MQPARIERQPERVFAGDLKRHRFEALDGIAAALANHEGSSV